MDENANSPDVPAGTRMIPVYQALAIDLIAMGVTDCFVLASEDTLPLLAALDASGVNVWAARHETNAVLAGNGYAFGSRRLGVSIIGRGPATANGMHGIVASARERVANLVITGDGEPNADPNAIGPDYKQFDALSVMTAAGVRGFRVTNALTARTVLRDAAQAAMEGQTVTLHVPVRIMHAMIDANEAPGGPVELPTRAGSRGRDSAIRSAAQLLMEASRPLIVAGLGAHKSGARDALERLAEQTGALLVTSVRGKDMFKDSPYHIGILGSFSHSVGRRHIENSDCVIVFGAGLNFWTSSRGDALPKDAQLIHVDANRHHIGRYHPADVAIVGDARTVAEQLCDATANLAKPSKPLHDKGVLDEIANFDLRTDFIPENTSRTLDPRVVAMALEDILPKKRNIIYDSGNFFLIAGYLSVPDPGSFKITTDFASIGTGMGTAVGYVAARPDELNVLFIGDGGFLMTISELETFARCGLPIVIVVLNDAAFGAEVHQGRGMNLPDAVSVFADIDFAPVAEAFGYRAATVRTEADLEALRDTFADWSGPILIDCKINGEIQAPFIGELIAGKKH